MPTTRHPNPRTTHAFRRASTASIALAVLMLGVGCAAPAPRGDASPEVFEDVGDIADVSYTVQRGDRLGDIAREFTGDVSLWEEIAASNGIVDPRSLRAGSVLLIPAELIPGHAERSEPVAVRDPMPARRVPTDAPAAVTPGLAVRQAAPVELSPVDVNRRFELSPIDERATPAGSGDGRGARLDFPGIDAPGGRQVKVIGSYFPKGIYAQPATYSKLLMRVAPGTLFELDAEVGDWYGVVTSEGVGYLRDGDGRVVGDGERTASLGSARG